MPDIQSIPLASLVIDVQNPRLPQPNVGQRDALRAIASDQKEKLQALAADIVKFGLNLADLSIVMPLGDDTGRHVVLEGNRRLTAIRALENPEFLVGAVNASVVAAFRRMHKDYQQAPIESVSCLIVRDRHEADHWIELRHTGPREGAGIVPWGSDQRSRWESRGGKIEVHTQALDFLEGRGDLTPQVRRDVPATSFKRLVQTVAVRERLGIEVQRGRLMLLADENAVAKALMHVIHDLTIGGKKTGDIYTLPQRVKYAETLPASVVVTPTRQPGHGVAVGSASSTAPTPPRGATARAAVQRDRMIPRDCVLKVAEQRCKKIEGELRKLSMKDFPNAVGVLLRVFVELTADDFVKRNGLSTSVNDKLNTKLLAVTTDLVAKRRLTKQEAAPVRRAAARDSFLAPSVALLNEYAHNLNMHPAVADLRSYWDELQPFFIAVWTP